MRINLAKSAGFCFGVKRAITIALDTARSRRNVRMLGDIVHNEFVVKSIERAGIKKIKRLCEGKDRVLLIRAHGTAAATLQTARRLGYSIVDATCPMVKEIHAIALKLQSEGYAVIVIGDKRHDEVRGIVGQLSSKAIIIENTNSIPRRRLRRIQKAGIVVQSTQNIDKVNAIVDEIRAIVPEVKFCDTICRPTRTKQKEIHAMPLENDCMVIIGSKESANTKRLYEISKSLNPKSYWVASDKELEKEWFRGMRSVGVTAGASTPQEIIRAVIEKISGFSAPNRT